MPAQVGITTYSFNGTGHFADASNGHWSCKLIDPLKIYKIASDRWLHLKSFKREMAPINDPPVQHCGDVIISLLWPSSNQSIQRAAIEIKHVLLGVDKHSLSNDSIADRSYIVWQKKGLWPPQMKLKAIKWVKENLSMLIPIIIRLSGVKENWQELYRPFKRSRTNLANRWAPKII